MEDKKIGYKKDNPILRFVHDSFTEDVRKIIDDENYKVVGSVGKGNMATCPTLCVLDKEITQSTRFGFYIAYLFKKDMSGLYLSFAWGSTQFDNTDGYTYEDLDLAVEEVQNLVSNYKEMNFNDTMVLSSSKTDKLPKSYERGSIIFKYYEANNIPAEEELVKDLNEYLDIYTFAKENYNGRYASLINKIENKKGKKEISKEQEVETEKNNSKYTEEDFLRDVYVKAEDYSTLVKLLANKKNLIIQGPPGVGKTYLAKRLAYSRMKCKDSERVKMIQFHQSYSYEDFILGYRPSREGFKLEEGPFYKFCFEAIDNPNKDYYFIIDEINRGNLSKIFGELFMLIENDKRGEEYAIELLYSDDEHEREFYIPENLYIIGLMNTADRSLAMVDYALRRRFAFFYLEPAFEDANENGFNAYFEQIKQKHLEDYNIFEKVIKSIKSLNEDISGDDSLRKGFCIGHSYFCHLLNSENLRTDLKFIIDYEILPLLEEYWFDEKDNNSIKAIKNLSDELKSDES